MTPPARPAWARRLDRWTLRAARLGGRLVGRPSDALLAALARKDRPGMHAPDTVWSEAASAEAHIAAGRLAFERGQHAEALFRYGEAIAAAPEAAWAWHGRGDALQLLGQHEAALEAYSRAVALAPEGGLHEAGRANALDALGRQELAAQAWDRALALDPGLGWMRRG